MRPNVIRNLLQFLLIGTLLMSLKTQAQNIQVSMLTPPVTDQTSLSRVITDAKGNVHLSWVASKDDNSALYYATLTDANWSPAHLIQQGNDWFVNWADFPFLAVTDTGMVAHWLQKSAEGTYDYDINAVFFDQEKQFQQTASASM